jgi:hypothetical protein
LTTAGGWRPLTNSPIVYEQWRLAAFTTSTPSITTKRDFSDCQLERSPSPCSRVKDFVTALKNDFAATAVEWNGSRKHRWQYVTRMDGEGVWNKVAIDHRDTVVRTVRKISYKTSLANIEKCNNAEVTRN